MYPRRPRLRRRLLPQVILRKNNGSCWFVVTQFESPPRWPYPEQIAAKAKQHYPPAAPRLLPRDTRQTWRVVYFESYAATARSLDAVSGRAIEILSITRGVGSRLKQGE